MSLASYCTSDNLVWETDLMTGYHYANEDGQIKTVMRYQIPLDPEKEAVFIAKYDISLGERRSFYENLVRCIQREVSVSSYLAERKVPSILAFSNIEQVRDDTGVVSIYLETEQIC